MKLHSNHVLKRSCTQIPNVELRLIKKVSMTIWAAIIWAIWNGKNEYMFNGNEF